MASGKSSRSELWIAVVLSTVCWLCGTSQGVGFTYQGRLMERGEPAEGRFDLFFAVLDQPEEGRRLTETIVRENVEVAGGHIMVELDFGDSPAVFNGEDRWLGISVRRTASAGPKMVLRPRQKVTGAPSSLRAQSADLIIPLEHMPQYVVRVNLPGESGRYFHFFEKIGSKHDIIPFWSGSGGPAGKIVGLLNIPPVRLQRCVGEDMLLPKWLGAVIQGSDFKKDITITILDRMGYPIDRWHLVNAWPSKLLSETDSLLETVVERVEIVAEGITRIKIPDPKVERDVWYPGPQPVVQLPLHVTMGEEPVREFDRLKGLGWNIEVVELRDGTKPGNENIIKTPGRIQTLDITLGRPAVNSDEELWQWRERLSAGQLAIKNVQIVMKDGNGHTVRSIVSVQSWLAELSTVYNRERRRVDDELVIAVHRLQPAQ
ncbi:MAG: phage tail protein, partial [Planctomycetota bacterium]